MGLADIKVRRFLASPENMSRKTMLLFGALLAIGAAGIPTFTYTTNCGGNSAALTTVRTYVALARVEAMDSPVHAFHVTSATPQQREQLAQLPGKFWLRRAHFLVSTVPVAAESTERRVIIVCDTPYTNVPRRWLGSAPPVHAAGFSDGSTGLISTTEFAALNRTSFVALNDLYPINSK
jgi:hypothetical protein